MYVPLSNIDANQNSLCITAVQHNFVCDLISWPLLIQENNSTNTIMGLAF